MDLLVLEPNEEREASLSARLGEAGCCVLARVSDTTALEAALEVHCPDLIVLDLVRADRGWIERAGALGRTYLLPVVVFVEETDAEATRAALRAGIAGYVVRGAHVGRLRDALEVARARFALEQALREKLASVEAALAERKVIEQAKGRLMQQAGLDEQGAHDALCRLAMRRNCKVVEVARAVLERERAGPR